MATMDRFGALEHSDERPARSASFGWLMEATTWFALAIIGVATVFIGLAVDAYKHNHGGGEETLLSFSNPGHAIAGIGLAMAGIAVLAGFATASLKHVDTTKMAYRRFVPILGAFVLLTATVVGSTTYIGATGATVGHTHSDGTAAAADHTHPADTTGGDAGVAQALKDQGIDTGGGSGTGGGNNNQDPSQVPGALTQGSNGTTGSHQHDHGKQPTFTQLETMSQDQLMPLFPADTITTSDFGAFKDQVEQVRAVAEKYNTPELAKAAGYVNTTSDVPYMGQHYLNYDLVKKGIFDPAHPQGLLFSKIDGGEEKLVGVWFLLIPGINGITRDVEPAGFAGNLDLWHAHTGLCLVALSGASEGETKESCTAKGGNFTNDLRWMMHVWVTPETTENPDGVFAYLNGDLFEKQQAAKQSASNPSGVTP